MKLKASIEHKPNIPTASMADIAFLLIIFFMLTITFEVDKTQVQLPKTTLRFEIPKKAAYVSIDPNGRIRVSDGNSQSSLVSAADEVLSMAATVISTLSSCGVGRTSRTPSRSSPRRRLSISRRRSTRRF